ncbi:hypothetical protein QA648_34865 (plasmid) [Rhizobium sp. CB3171]|uniref:hypothetical protein n=1 Tax=Rhizobium sp. CB3171 TaxID=3039157 RepID=UPI0024B20616|nr:hypothetical protein [Rhizobium sp. CB3171]WFU07260.1 hypothetical protein QA648_34865 [Rhizobium sp. CB3171]
MSGDTEAGGAGWLGDEIISSGLPDKRLARRMHRLLDQMVGAWSPHPGGVWRLGRDKSGVPVL